MNGMYGKSSLYLSSCNSLSTESHSSGERGRGEGGREERGGRQGGREREIGGRDKGYSTCCPSRNAIDHAPKRYKDK